MVSGSAALSALAKRNYFFFFFLSAFFLGAAFLAAAFFFFLATVRPPKKVSARSVSVTSKSRVAPSESHPEQKLKSLASKASLLYAREKTEHTQVQERSE